MPQKIDSSIIRVCKLCGKEFHPHARKQFCCNEVRTVYCKVCGKPFEVVCNTSSYRSTCSKECTVKLANEKRAQTASREKRICKWCGKEFVPKTSRDVYCYDAHFQKCEVCGKLFEVDARHYTGVKTCSAECQKALMMSHRDLERERANYVATLMERYGVSNSMQIPGSTDKIKATNKAKYGEEWYTQTLEYKEAVKKTSLEKYGHEHFLSSEIVKKKREDTCYRKYGSKNIFSSEYGKEQCKNTMLERYGQTNPSNVLEFKKKAIANSRTSKLEQRVTAILGEYDIKYVHQYTISNTLGSHVFDFYLPKYNMLIDCDGVYYHSYLDDPDGKHVLDYYDEERLALIPEGWIFHVIVEGNEEKDFKWIVDCISKIDEHAFDYEGEIFKWCRSIEFPYPSYDKNRMTKDYNRLCSYHSDTYVPSARIGDSAISQFHKSIYDAHVGSCPSPKEAWYNDALLKKVIKNRLIYKNDVDPYKVMKGFNISKICPRVSVFNPVLARYLVEKYLSEFDEVFDPFSGFSGRLLGVASTGKKYVGYDINSTHVAESNEIIKCLDIENASVNVRDALQSSGSYLCLLTCPPYGRKEIYGDEITFKSCDEWIDECLHRFDCKRYVFVVDETCRYSSNVIEDIKATSHFCKVVEKVVVIDNS